jgi:hypothetical protein
MDFNELAARNQEAFVIREEVESFIAQRAQESEILKSRQRMKAEAEVYAYLYCWQELARPRPKRPIGRVPFFPKGAFSIPSPKRALTRSAAPL